MDQQQQRRICGEGQRIEIDKEEDCPALGAIVMRYVINIMDVDFGRF